MLFLTQFCFSFRIGLNIEHIIGAMNSILAFAHSEFRFDFCIGFRIKCSCHTLSYIKLQVSFLPSPPLPSCTHAFQDNTTLYPFAGAASRCFVVLTSATSSRVFLLPGVDGRALRDPDHSRQPSRGAIGGVLGCHGEKGFEFDFRCFHFPVWCVCLLSCTYPRNPAL